ncbi:MAG: thermonuclease family protein [Verrucomicrobiae bacterium]|nr:thermonuclease family protein [Verrucomicrobiae bacterium]NNJ41976.1 hypothetical protein [Akkermansiaceae bacterium]
MTTKKKKILSKVVTVVIILAVIWMQYDESRDDENGAGNREENVKGEAGKKVGRGAEGMLFPDSASELREVTRRLVPVNLSSSKLEVLHGCRLMDHRGNDGDSFHVITKKGHKEFRLYYVDTPESAAKTYRSGENNFKRIAQQGVALGGLTREETTQVGVEAKRFVKKLLKAGGFRVVTRWENVYDARRQYAFIIVPWQGESRYLHELLVAHGLARIYTKPATLPDNTSATRHKKRLRALEQHAQKSHYGAWGMK